MLKEVPGVRQRSDEPSRRWFVDERLELIAWQAADGAVVAFQLAYRIGAGERVLTWRQHAGLSHDAVDDGELPAGRHKQSPIMVPDGDVPWQRLRQDFRSRAHGIDARIASAVIDVLGG